MFNLNFVVPFIQILKYFPGKMRSLASIENMTSRFSYRWIPYNSIVNRTGICMKFSYKMTGNNNTLSLSFQTLSGDTTLIWDLHGDHGNTWRTGVITYRPNEKLAVGQTTSYIAFSVCLFFLFVCSFVPFYCLFTTSVFVDLSSLTNFI